MAIKHWEKDKDKSTVTINGVPLLATEFEVSPLSEAAFEPVEKKIVESGVLILAGHKAQREVKIKCEFIELTKEVASFIQNLDGKIVTLCSPHLNGCMKGHAKAEVKYDVGEWGHFIENAKDARTYGEVTFTVKETIEPKTDRKLPTREEEEKKPAEAPKPEPVQPVKPPEGAKPAEVKPEPEKPEEPEIPEEPEEPEEPETPEEPEEPGPEEEPEPVRPEPAKPIEEVPKAPPKPKVVGKPIQTTLPKAKIVGLFFKPSCAWCSTGRVAGERFRYIWYEVGWDNICPHCGRASLVRRVSRRVPEGALHCTNRRCGARYCGVCGREKVWNRRRAEKYRVKNIIPPKPKKQKKKR